MAQGTPSSCDAVAELIPGYALEALTQADQALVEGHVAGCPGCRAMLAEDRTLAEGLVYTAPLVAAPPHLEADLRRRLNATRTEQAVSPLPTRLSRLLSPAARPALAVTALLVLSLLGTNLYWGWTTNRLRVQQSILAHELEEVELDEKNLYDAVRVLATGGRTVILPGLSPAEAIGRLILAAGQQGAFLVIEGLPPLPADKVYQFWLRRNGEHESGGLFTVDSAGLGVLVVKSPRPVADYQAATMTVEPAGGSASPTGPSVMGGSLS